MLPASKAPVMNNYVGHAQLKLLSFVDPIVPEWGAPYTVPEFQFTCGPFPVLLQVNAPIGLRLSTRQQGAESPADLRRPSTFTDPEPEKLRLSSCDRYDRLTQQVRCTVIR